VHARASATAAATAAAAVAAADAAAAEAAAAATAATAASSVLWARGIPLTPAELEVLYPEGSGETWYVVLCGHEPGMYRTPYAFSSFILAPLITFHTGQRPTPSATASPIRSRPERPVVSKPSPGTARSTTAPPAMAAFKNGRRRSLCTT
jgi:hypothetical protein